MKKTLLKAGVVASTLLGISVVGITPAQSAVITPADPLIIAPDNPGPVCDFTKAIACSGVVSGNDNQEKLRTFLTEFGIDASKWGDRRVLNPNTDFIARINVKPDEASPNTAPNTTPDEGFIGPFNPIFEVSYNGNNPLDSKSGGWRVNKNRTGFTPFVLALKAGNNVTFNYFDGNNVDDFSGAWDTSRLGNKGYSHATLWAPSDLVGVPSPALLPGLVGMGVTAWRKKKTQKSMG